VHASRAPGSSCAYLRLLPPGRPCRTRARTGCHLRASSRERRHVGPAQHSAHNACTCIRYAYAMQCVHCSAASALIPLAGSPSRSSMSGLARRHAWMRLSGKCESRASELSTSGRPLWRCDERALVLKRSKTRAGELSHPRCPAPVQYAAGGSMTKPHGRAKLVCQSIRLPHEIKGLREIHLASRGKTPGRNGLVPVPA
jgi:hypothetical protein